MLSEVLKKSTCAECKFCCSFRRCSLWETPLFSEKFAGKYSNEKNSFNIEEKDAVKFARMDLASCYKTDNENEEVACFYLDNEKGCVLSEEEKPFDCKIWPLRIMKKGETKVIALTPTCPSINEVGIERMKELVNGGLGDIIYKQSMLHPYIVKDYKEGFPILAEFTE